MGRRNVTKSGLNAPQRRAGRRTLFGMASAGQVRKLAVLQAVHIAAALEQHRWLPAVAEDDLSVVILIKVDDPVPAARLLVVGEFLGEMSLSDDDTLVAGAAM